jgi:hypothetical protein
MLHMEAEVERKLLQMSLLSKENAQLKLKHQVRLAVRQTICVAGMQLGWSLVGSLVAEAQLGWQLDSLVGSE